MMKTLPELFSDIPITVLNLKTLPPVEVSSITADSRNVQPGSLFVALVGEKIDGHHFIPQVIERGAAAVVGSYPLSGISVPYIRVAESTRLALAYLSAAFYDFPARKMTIIGVTGTDGKTTTSSLIFHILNAAGIRAGLISTVNAMIGNDVVDTGFHVTTPDAPDVQLLLVRMVEAGLTHVVIESTSHGLAQHRVAACEFDIGVVTNITHEHLDYHRSYEAYRAAKAKLFTDLSETHSKLQGNPRLAVLNRDDRSYDFLSQITKVRKIAYGLGIGADVTAQDIQHCQTGLKFKVKMPGFESKFAVASILIGNFNVSNILAAMTVTLMGLGMDREVVVKAIRAYAGVPGRMERIELGQEFTALVDFAHTPNALKVALETCREMTTGKLWVVFGSAGLRDRQKRRMMAETAVKLADITILTAEDPRTESLEEILAEMADAANRAGGVEGKTFFRVSDRGEAICMAVQMAQAGDLVVACGKGHEQSMCFGEIEYPWDDRIAMRAALADRLGLPGLQMLKLPTSK